MKNAFKKAFTGAVAVLTIVWSVGLVNLPMTAKAAEAGDVIKGTTLSTLYYYGSDGSRYAFPNEKTYLTWYEDFDDVETLSDSDLAAIPLAGNIVYRPGSRWIKIESDPKTYAVTPEGAIRWIETEEVAEGLAGSDWNAFIDDVSDTFFVDYTVGTSLMSAADAYNGALVADGSDTYLVWDDATRAVSSAGMTANRLQTRFVLDGSGIVLSGITAGDDLDAEDAELVDTAQLGGTVVTEGGLSISLASDTPASTTVPAEADSVEFATLKLVATDGAVSVDQMVFRLGGVGATTNISNCYLYEGNDRLTNSRSINSTTREVTFSSLDLDIEDGDTMYLTIRVDVAAAATTVAGDTVYFSLVEADDVTTDSSVSGNFPISGNSMTFSDTEAGTLTIIDNGSITDPTLGEEGATIAKVKFTAATEGASITQVMFDVDNAADHDNFELYDGSTLLGEGTVSGKKVTFALSTPFEVDKGDNETLLVKADIGGEAADVISVAIEESADVMATGSIYGFNMGIDVTGFDQTGNANCTTECSESTVQGGDLTFAFNGPSAANIALDSDDAVFMNFTLTAGNWVQVKGIDVLLDGTDDGGTNDGLIQTDSEANLTDISIRLEDGTVWMGPEEIPDLADSGGGEDNQQTLTFDDYQDLQAGESLDLMITADVPSDAPSADVFYVMLDMSATSAEDINGDDLTVATDIVPTSDITGYNMTLSSSSLTINESSSPWTSTYIKGSSDASVVGYNFTAGTSHSITVSDVTFTGTGDDDGTFNNEDNITMTNQISSCSIYDGVTGSLVDGPEGLVAGTNAYTIPFTSFEWTIDAGETNKLTLKCDLANVAPEGTDVYKFFIATTDSAPDALTAQDDEGDSVTACYDVDNDGGTCATDTSDDLAYGSVGATVPTITVSNAGTLTITVAADTPISTIILGSSTGVSLSKHKLTAANEAFVVNKMTFDNCYGAAFDGANTCAGTAGTDNVVDDLTATYTNSDGESESVTGYFSGGEVTFSGMDLYVGADASAYITVTADTNAVSSTGATTGTLVAASLKDVAGDLEAVGQSSGTTLTGATVTYTADASNEMTIRKTKPTISLSSGSPDGAATPGANKEALRFNIAADSRGYITVEELAFQIDTVFNGTEGTGDWNECWGDTGDGTTNADGTEGYGFLTSSFTLYKTSTLSDPLETENADWTLLESDGSACEDDDNVSYVVLDLSTTTDDAFEIGAGSTETFSLYVTTTGASTSSDDGLQITIPLAPVLSGATGTDAGLVWLDDSDTTELGDTYLALPLYGGVLVY